MNDNARVSMILEIGLLGKEKTALAGIENELCEFLLNRYGEKSRMAWQVSPDPNERILELGFFCPQKEKVGKADPKTPAILCTIKSSEVTDASKEELIKKVENNIDLNHGNSWGH